MSALAEPTPQAVRQASGVAPEQLAKLLALWDGATGLRRVWVFGSRARGDFRPASDIDLVLDMPDAADFSRLAGQVEALGLLYRVDMVRWQDPLEDGFRQQIARDRQLFWEPRRGVVSLPRTLGATDLKKFQDESLQKLDAFVTELRARKAESDAAVAAMTQFKAMEHLQDSLRTAADYPRHAWDALRKAHALPPAFATLPHSSRWDGAGRAIPNICLKVPTGGGKTLLAAASVGKVFNGFCSATKAWCCGWCPTRPFTARPSKR